MIGVDLGKEIIIPSSVAVIGALIAGLSAVVKSWFENRDARRKAERQLELAKNRTEFVKQWIAVSKELREDTGAVDKAIDELNEAYSEAQVAFSRTKSRSVVAQLGRLLMLVRRKNPASYVVSGVFLFVSIFVWLFLCTPVPGDDSFGYPAAVFSAFFSTIVLRVVAEMVVRVFEQFAGSGALSITNVALKSNVATITTSADHNLRDGQGVVVDASYDVFDGTFTVAELPETPATEGPLAETAAMRSETPATEGALPETAAMGAKTFSYFLSAPDIKPTAATGTVYLDTVKDQFLALLMLRRKQSRRAHVVSALFLVSLLGFSYFAVSEASEALKADDYPLCYTDEYRGSYYGDVDSNVLFSAVSWPDEEGNFDVAVEEVAAFLELGPLWSNEFADFTIIRTEEVSDKVEESTDSVLEADTGDESVAVIADEMLDEEAYDYHEYVLEADTGEEYLFDEFGLYFADGTTVLYERGLDNNLHEIGDPCDPQTVKVRKETIPIETTDFTALESPMFAYYTDDWELVFLRMGKPNVATESASSVQGYFGRDGRFMPICSADAEEVQPCVLEENVVYDSGLSATVSLLFKTGMQIIAFAIAARLFFGLIVWGFDRYSTWREGRRAWPDPQPATAVAGAPPT